MRDLDRWLEQHRLAKYAERFAENEIELEDLSELGEEDLREIGLPMGPRRRLLKAVRAEFTSGSDLPSRAAVPVESSPAPQGEAERRQLTVMFADLVGSTELAERLDPEDLRQINRQYQDIAKEAIESYGGFVARYMGDGVLAYFGFPSVHEDDPERAVRAGLSLTENLRAANTIARLAVRVGVATGAVVVGDLVGEGSSQENAVVGETPNLAARLQGLASPNVVVVSETTKTLVGGAFHFEALPNQAIKGFSERITPYKVEGERLGQSRFDSRAGNNLSPFVGRDEEVELLSRRWERTEVGQGTAALIVGEPGIGKSRLVEQLRAMTKGSRARLLFFQCSSHNRNTAFFPLLRQLEAELIELAAGRRIGFELVQEYFGTGDSGSMLLPYLLANALGIEGPDPGPGELAGLDPDARRRQLMSGLTDYILSQVSTTRLLCVFEDLHWADPSTLELLSRLVESLADRPVLLLTTTRPGFSASWSDLPHCRVISLPRLEGSSAAALASSISGLSAEIIATVTDRAGGNPLFIEELAHALADGSRAHSGKSAIPATLQDSLMARLDATGIGRSVAQCAAVLGRDFSRTLLTATWDGDSTTLDSGLTALVDTGLLYERVGGSGDQEFSFKHALVRDAAYGTLLRGRRRGLHRRAAEHLIPLREANPRAASFELIAYHLSESADLPRALRYWVLAGESAAGSSSYRECEAHVRRALDSISAAEEPSAFIAEELELLVLLGPALMALYGYSARAVGEVYERARTISEQTSGKPHLTPILNALRLHRITHDGVMIGLEPANALLAHAEILDDNASRIEGRKAVGSTLLWTAQFAEARDALSGAIALYEMGEDMDVMRVDSDSGLTCHSFMSLVEWASGFLDRSIDHSERAVEIANASGRAFGIGEALSFRSLLLHLHREHEASARTALDAYRLADDHNYVLWKAMSSLAYGATLVAQGNVQSGLEQLQNSHQILKEMGYLLWQPIYLAELGRGFGLLQDNETALALLNEALEVSGQTEEVFWRPEIHRNMGVLLLQMGNPESGCEAFQRALESATETNSKMCTLRAATSLARYLDGRGERTEARNVLAPVYESFEEGFGNADLRDAKALLEGLA